MRDYLVWAIDELAAHPRRLELIVLLGLVVFGVIYADRGVMPWDRVRPSSTVVTNITNMPGQQQTVPRATAVPPRGGGQAPTRPGRGTAPAAPPGTGTSPTARPSTSAGPALPKPDVTIKPTRPAKPSSRPTTKPTTTRPPAPEPTTTTKPPVSPEPEPTRSVPPSNSSSATRSVVPTVTGGTTSQEAK